MNIDVWLKKKTQKGTLSSPQRRFKIVNAVLLVHIAVLVIPPVAFMVTDYFRSKKKKDVIVVKLVEIPKEITKVTEKSGSRRKVEKTKPQPKKPKVQPKPKTQPKPKSQPVKTAAKPRKTVAKPVSKTVSTVKKATVKPKYVPPSPPDDLEVLRPEDLKKVPTQSTDDPDEEDDEFGATYNEQLVGVIYKLWQPPNKQVLANRKPEVFIAVRINRFGKVLERKIIKKSGFWPMDLSVDEFFKKLTQLPAPPNEVWMKNQRNGSMGMEFVLVPFE